MDRAATSTPRPGSPQYVSVQSTAAGVSGVTVKRRRIRKGTRSCWECKRRKVRCEFVSPADAVCDGCRHRGTDCVGQDYAEDAPPPPVDRNHRMDDCVQMVERIVRDVLKSVGNESSPAPSSSMMPAVGGCDHTRVGDMSTPPAGIPTPSSTESGLSGCSAPTKSPKNPIPGNVISSPKFPTLKQQPHGDDQAGALTGTVGTGKYANLSRLLHAALPSREVVEAISNAGSPVSVSLVHHMRTQPLEIEHDTQRVAGKLLDIPEPTEHPIIIARYMLTLATFLQYLHPVSHESFKGMSEAPHDLMRRLVDVASSHVTTRDELLGSIESLECVTLEATFQANTGNLRRAWLTFRRAIGLAQLMGIHRRSNRPPVTFLDPRNTKVDTQVMWFRLVYVDRFLCLMQGLPPATADNELNYDGAAALGNRAPMDRLERIHCCLALRVLQRNEASPGEHDYTTTQEIEAELQKAANHLPGGWWLTPNLAATEEHAVFGETLRLVNQLFHYNLLNQLYLPFMLRSIRSNDSAGEASQQPDQRHDYAKLTCVNASREMLTRFIAFRSFNRIAFCCRSVDFFALMAAMTLLLAHLDCHRIYHERGAASQFACNMLANQRLSDLAMMEEVLDNMYHVSRLNTDVLSQKSADLLRWLLAIEAEAAGGRIYHTERVNGQASGGSHGIDDGGFSEGAKQQSMRMNLPYFGLIKIIRGCLAPKKTFTDQPSLQLQQQGPTQNDLSSCKGGPPSQGDGVSHITPSNARDNTPSRMTAANPEVTSLNLPQQQIGSWPSAPVRTPNLQSISHSNSTGETTTRQGGRGYPTVSSPPLATQLTPILYPPQQQSTPPDSTEMFDDWILQGVDINFCDNVMRGSSLNGFVNDDDGHNWANWQMGPPA
ncbi:hypothetical protein DL770_001900 [Monosporascus sp. CRB-9-2]|nr:hypothetical protein DL770_001900 [Monosporascus sp. CRB-9-2]